MEIFNHPIVQGVISNAIYGLILLCGSAVIGAVSYFGWWRLIGQWFVSESKIPKWLLITGAVAVALGTWRISHNRYIAPLKEQVASLEEEIAERDKIISGWSDAYKSSRNQNEPLLENYKKLESYLAECQSNLKQWSAESQNIHKQWKDALEVCRKENTGLQKTVNSYVRNCSIIKEYRDLDNRKIQIDNWRNENRYEERTYETLKSQSDGLQARIIVLHNKLTCEPQ